MKLHLPSLLRRALLTCMAAVSTVAVSVGSGTVAAGSAFLLISSSSVSQAEITGPVNAQGLPITYKEYYYDLAVGDDAILSGRNWFEVPSGDVDEEGNRITNIDLHVNAGDMSLVESKPNDPLGIKTDAGTNLKITLDGTGDNENITLSANTDIRSTTLWVTGARNSLVVGQVGLTQSIQDIYVENVALQFSGSYQGPNELHANFHIGSSSYADGTGSLNGSALIFGSQTDQVIVSTSGGLEVDSAGSMIGFNKASQFTVRGALSGSGNLALSSAVGAAGRLILAGGSKDFTGAIDFGQAGGTELYFGADITLGGIFGGAAGVAFGAQGVGSLNLTLNVRANQDYRFTSSGSNLWASGIYLRKSGTGSQLISNFSGSGIAVAAGTLSIGGSSSTIGSRGVAVTGGTLEFFGPGNISFTSGEVKVSGSGAIRMLDHVDESDISGLPRANMEDVKLTITDTASFSSVGYISLGDVDLLKNGSLSLTGTTDLGYASMRLQQDALPTHLNFESGNLVLGGTIANIHNAIELGSGMKVTVNSGTRIDLSSLGNGYTLADVGKSTFSYVVDVLHAAAGATVQGWNKGAITFTNRDGSSTKYEVLEPSNGSYSAGVSWDNAIIVQEMGTTEVNWRNGRNVEGVQIWQDGTSSLVLRRKSAEEASTHSVVFITGSDNSDLSSGSLLSKRSEYERSAAQIFVDDNTEMIFRQSVNTYVAAGANSATTERLGNVKWGHMLLMGTLTLKDKGVIGSPDEVFLNTVDSGPNALVVIDWRSTGLGDVFGYDTSNEYVGNSSNLPVGYTGKLEVRSGIFLLGEGDNFSEIVVKSGGQLALNNFAGRTFNGKLTLSGNGLVDNSADHDEVGVEPGTSALKFVGNTHITGSVTIADAATIHCWITETGYIDAPLIGAGLGQLTFTRALNANDRQDAEATLVVNGKVEGIKLFNVKDYSVLEIRSDYDAANIDEATVESRRFNHMDGNGLLRFTRTFTGFDRVTIGGSGTLELTSSTSSNGVESSFGADVPTFTKDGAGYMNIYRHFDVPGAVTITGGTLRFGNSADCAYRLGASDINVMNSCTFVISHRAEDFNTNILLSGATLQNGAGWRFATQKNPYYKFRTLTLQGSRSSINWLSADNASPLDEGFYFEKITGNGDLEVATMKNDDINSQLFRVDEIENYAGTIYLSINRASNLSQTKKIIVGTVHQDIGWSGAIETSGGAYVLSDSFRKTGAGSFGITNLSVSNEVWMNYDGELEVEEIKFANETILHYTSADNDRVILSSGAETDTAVKHLFIDVLSLSDEQLNRGINLGFYTNVENAVDTFYDKLVIGGLGTPRTDYTLYSQNGRLYLSSSKGIDKTWDRSMGVKALAYAPTMDELNAAACYLSNKDDFNWGDSGSFFEMGRKDSSNRYISTKFNQTITLAKLVSGTGGAKMSALGGLWYDGDSPSALEAQSYLYMDGATYRMLIGGSSNSNAAAEANTGFFGGSHIQIESGTVDYIVAGNHLSSGDFHFEGDSFVSIHGGTIKGGIVGGNTYAGGGGAFEGSSHIFIYTALTNPGSVSTIGLPEDLVASASPFTMVVGGSAYVSDAHDAKDRSAIAFTGDSEIVVDLSSYSGAAAFGKSIVGGNAYLADKETGVDDWGSTFTGNSSITITGKKTNFEGVVVGASHHDIAGAQSVRFVGDTQVSINGGVFKEAVVGGSYHGANSTGNYGSVIVGDTQVDIADGAFWRVTGGSYVLSSGQTASSVGEDGSVGMSLQDGNSGVSISGGAFDHTAQQSAAGSKAAAETYRGFAAGGRYLAGLRGDAAAHVLTGSASLAVTGGNFNGTVLVGGDFVSSSVPAGMGRYVNASAEINFGTYAEVSGATITNGLVVGGSFLTDSSQGGSITVRNGAHLVIGEGATLTGHSSAALDGIAAVGGNYLDVGGMGHSSTTEDGSSVVMNAGSVTGHIVGGSVLKGYANTLSTSKTMEYTNDEGALVETEVKGATGVSLMGGTVRGNVYGGHYVGSAGADNLSSAITSVGAVNVVLDGASVTGNIYGGGHFSCSNGAGSEDYVQTQGDITVSLLSGSLSGDVYAAGVLGRPAEIRQNGAAPVQPDGARVITDSTRVELGSAFVLAKSSAIISGDYHLTDTDSTVKYHNETISGGRTLAFVDDGDFSKMKNWSGITFRDFDAIEVVADGDITLSAKQFAGASSGFTKLGEGSLTLGGALSKSGHVSVYGGTLVLEKKQDLSGGLHFDLTGRTSNSAESAFLQGNGGYTSSDPVKIFLDMTAADMETMGYGRYYLASNWDASTMNYIQQWVNDANSTREFNLLVENGCLVLHVRENSTNPWLWRGDTHHPIVGAYEWDPKHSANWNAHELFPDNASLNPDGQDVLFTASVGGEVLVGELVHPSSVTVASGNYVFRQRSPEDEEGVEGIWTDRLVVGGAFQEAVLELALANRNINNIFLENNSTLILSDANAITSSMQRPEYNSIIYFNGGKLVYGEEFTKDISWQIAPQGSTGMIRVDVAANHVAPDEKGEGGDGAITWGKLYDSENANTWALNPGISQAMREGMEKGGEGTLRILWGSSEKHYENINEAETAGLAFKLPGTKTSSDEMVGSITASAGLLEFLMNGATPDNRAVFRFRGELQVDEGAEMVFSIQRKGVVTLENTLVGEGSIVLGRQLGDESEYTRLGCYRCPVQGHGGAYLTAEAGAPYVIAGRNSDFFGTIVLEGDGSREARNYIQLGQRYSENPVTVNGFEKYADVAETDNGLLFNYSVGGVMVALGGGKTTLVLAGRHLTTTGMIYYGGHSIDANQDYDSPILDTFDTPYGRYQGSIDWQMFGPKHIRAGVVEVREDTLTYVGSTCQDSETDNDRMAATVYRYWDDGYTFSGKLTGSGVLAIAWGGFDGSNGCGNYKPGTWQNSDFLFGQGAPFYEMKSHFPYWGLSGRGGAYVHTLYGPMSEFTGTLVAGDLQSNRDGTSSSNAAWIFSASSAAVEASERSVINAKLAGGGTMIFNYTQDTVLAGAIGDGTYGVDTRITNRGSGKIILGSNRNISSGLLYLDGADIELGDADHYANWVGTAIRGNNERFFTLVNGELASAMQPTEGSEVRIRVETSSLVGTKVNAGGTLGTDIYEIIINKDGFLSGVWENVTTSRDATSVRLVFSRNNVGKTAEGQHMIELRYNRSLVVEDADFFVLDFGVDSIVDLLKEEASAPQSELYLHVLSKGKLEIPEGMWDDLLADGGDGARLLSQLGLYIERIENGEIVMKAIGGHRAYCVFSDPASSDSHTVNQYDILSGYEAVIVEAGQTLNINLMGTPEYGTRDYLAGGAVVPNLWGERGSAVVVTNTNPSRGRINIIFENADPYDGTLSSNFYGTITGGDAVDFIKTGAGTLTIGYHDKFDTAGGFYGDSLEIRKGGIVLQGKENEVRGTLTFSYSTDAEENSGLTLLNGETTVGKIVEGGSHAGPITMGGNAKLTLTGEEASVWNDIVLRRESDQSTGFFVLNAGSVDLANKEKTQLLGVHLSLQGDSGLSVNSLEGASVASLDGSGTLVANVAGTLKVTGEADSLFTGTLVSAEGAENTLHITNGLGVMTMRNVKNENLWSIHNDGKLVLDVSGVGAGKSAANGMSFGEILLGANSVTTYYINPDSMVDGELKEMITATKLTAKPISTLVVESKGDLSLFTGSDITIAKVNADSESDIDGLYYEIYGFSFLLHEARGLELDSLGNLHLQLRKLSRTENYWLHPNQEANAASGAKLVWEALWDSHSMANSGADGLRAMLVQLQKNKADYGTVDRALAGIAGTSTATLGPALAQDMERQLRAIRNRTTSMGANQSYVAGDGPAYHAWINAEGSYHKMEADSLAPGYTISNWGGTVGMDADVSGRTTVGLAITAMYGNLDSEAADRGDGKMDTYYLNFFAKTARGRWMHTVVGSIGLANLSLDRTITCGEATCQTSGSTNGYAFGLMYELGYSIPMNSEASYALQPLVNVTLRHASVSGYEESGNGAQLRVGDNTQTIFTLGAGVRAQAVVGENAYNRASVLEGRVIAKVDVGDNKGQVNNGLVYGSPSYTAPVESAELGSVGLELGVGLTVPLESSKGSIFMDASAELRSGYTSLNATVGYRIDF